MRRSGGFESFARSEAALPQASILPDVHSPAIQISHVYPFQSYFDSTLLETALVRQPPNDPIVVPFLTSGEVDPTNGEIQVPGYAIGLHPSSQTPVAVQFKVGGQRATSAPVVLKPGQVIRPHGLIKDMGSGSFSGFRMGLPFGWLGGGLATVVVFLTPDSNVTWTEHTEVLFHRARYAIAAPGDITSPFPKNWPLRFPWSQAFSDIQSQQGKASIGVSPTRTLMMLRSTALAAPANFRMLFQGSNDFGLDSAGAVITTEAASVEVAWPTYASHAVTGVSDYPVIELPGPVSRLAADDGGVAFSSTDAAIQGGFVDVVRYGTL